MIRCLIAFLILMPVAVVWAESDLRPFGLIDVTKEPFFADPTGERDATEALSEAMAYVRSKRLVMYLPLGTYKISDTLQASGPYKSETEDEEWEEEDRYWPLVMFGEKKDGMRPKIFLAPNSPGYEDPNTRKLVVYFHGQRDSEPEEPEKYPEPGPDFINNKLVGIDIEIGEGNPGAVAIRMRGAQGTGIEDSTINATHGLVGIEGACGSGGGHNHVTVIGGKIGMDATASEPSPSITGMTFIGQRETAILYRGQQTLNATGIKIITSSTGPAVLAEDSWTSKRTSAEKEPGVTKRFERWGGPISFCDSEIVFEGSPGVAFQSNSGVYLNNVYVKNARTLVDHESGGRLEGREGKWMRIREYAQSYVMRPFGNWKYTSEIYVDSKDRRSVVDVKKSSSPPSNLTSRHTWEDDFPSWQSEGAVNVKMGPYYAVGDGKRDDTKAIQSAIDDNEIVFIPKGRFLVRDTIDLRKNTKLVGLAPHLSAIVVKEGDDLFSDRDNPRPILRTPNDAKAEIVISHLGTWPRGEGAYNLLWRAGRKSTIRNWLILYGPSRQQPNRHHAATVVTGSGGGRWFNYYDETYSREYTPSYRHLLIHDTSEPFNIYQCNPEHARSQANLELLRARNVTLFGVKGDGNYTIAKMSHSRNIRVMGYGGSASPLPGTSVFRIEDCEDVLLANLFDSAPTDGDQSRTDNLTSDYDQIVDPDRWPMLIETFSGGKEFKAAPMERPVLYKRGKPRDSW